MFSPQPSIAIIGGGVMGSMFHGLLPNSTIITRSTFPSTAWDQFEVIVFAVRPQDFKSLTKLPFAQKLIVSVMAGISTTELGQLTSSRYIIRCMPNTTVRLGVGMTVWCKLNEVTNEQAHWFTTALSKQTRLLEVLNDDWIDRATAVSGCGPAYLLTQLKHFIQAAEQLGFTEEQSKALVMQTCRGVIALVENSDQPVDELVGQLVTKAGVTERALTIFSEHQLDQIWNLALQTAYERAKELSQ